MKKYNVFDLYVVKVDEYYFICEKTIRGYRDIFTKENLKNIVECEVEPLRVYYSLLAIANYTTGEPLTLTKKELLIKYAHLNFSNIERERQHSSNYKEFIKEQDGYIKALKEFQIKNPEKAKELAIESLKRTGIIDENEQVIFPYNSSSKTAESDEHAKILKK